MRKLLVFLAMLLCFASSVRADEIPVGSAYNRTVRMFATNSQTGATGLTLVISLSKNGGSYNVISPTVTEVGNGLYKIALAAANTDTVGINGRAPLDMYITASGADVTNTHDVVFTDPATAESGTAQSGSTSTTLNLASTANANDNFYQGNEITIASGTGAGQVRACISSVGSTKVATFGRPWIVTPDSTSIYAVLRRQTPVIDTSGRVTLAPAQSFNNAGQTTKYAVTVASGDFSDKTGFSLTSGEHTAIAGDVLNATASSYNAALTIGSKINAAASAGNPWTDTLTTYTAGQAGYILLNNLNATVGSRSTYAGGDTSGVTSLLSKIGNPAGASLSADVAAVKSDSGTLLSRLGTPVGATIAADIQTRMATFTYTTPPTVTAIRQEMDANSSKLDVAVGTRMATFTYTAPPTTAQIASAILSNSSNKLLTDSSGFVTATNGGGGGGTDVFALNKSGQTYSAGTWGAFFNNQLDQNVGSRSTYAGGDTSGVTTLLGRLPSALTISSGAVTVGGYASGQDPGTLTWANGTRTLTLYSDSSGITTVLSRVGTPTGASLSADIQTRMAGSAYAAPDNSGIAGIKAQTDQLAFTSGNLNSQVKGMDSSVVTALATAMDNAVVDGSLTRKQADAILVSFAMGSASYTYPTGAGAGTSTYKRYGSSATIYTANPVYDSQGKIVGRNAPTIGTLP